MRIPVDQEQVIIIRRGLKPPHQNFDGDYDDAKWESTGWVLAWTDSANEKRRIATFIDKTAGQFRHINVATEWVDSHRTTECDLCGANTLQRPRMKRVNAGSHRGGFKVCENCVAHYQEIGLDATSHVVKINR